MHPNDKISLELEAQQWQQVMDVLLDGKFRVVMPLIQELQKQLMAADGQRRADGTELPTRVPGGTNGAEAAARHG
jgi:hypothetical protein